jgi:hypothetical protein
MGRRRVEQVKLPSGVHTKKVKGRIYRYWHPYRGTAREGARVRPILAGVYCSPVLRHSAGLIQAANFRSAVVF